MRQKKFLRTVCLLVLAMSLVALLAACGGGNDAPSAGPNDTPNENTEPNDVQTPADTPDPEPDPEPEPEPDPTPTAIPVEIGGSIDNDNFLMTFDSMELLDEYKYSTGEHSSTSLYVEDGYKLLVVKGHFENKSTGAISDSAFAMSALVNDTYAVDGYDVQLHFQRSKYFEIDAYTDQDYVISINIPDKLAEQFETAQFTLAFKDDMSIPSTVWSSDGTKSIEADQYYTLSGTLGTAAAGDSGSEGSSAPATKGLWSMDHYVDDFQQPTDEWFITNTINIEGTFSNSATTNSKLLVQVAADEFEGESRVAFFLYEYGRNQVKNSSSNYVDEYDITMRDADGNDVSLTGTVYCGGDRLFIDDKYVNTVLDAMKGEGTLSFYIVDSERTTTTYLFSLETDNFGSLYAEVTG